MTKTKRFVKGITKEWTENISKEMPTIQKRATIHGQYHFYSRKKSMH